MEGQKWGAGGKKVSSRQAKDEALRTLVKEGKGVSSPLFIFGFFASGCVIFPGADSCFLHSVLPSCSQVTVIGKDAKKFDKQGKRTTNSGVAGSATQDGSFLKL